MNTSEFKYLDRTKNEYLMNKTMVLEEKLNKLRPPSIDLDHFNTFLVEGRNKLEMEVTAFFQTTSNKDAYILPKQIFEKPKDLNEVEYL